MRRARIREGALWGAKIVSTFPEWAGLQAKPNFRHPQDDSELAVRSREAIADLVRSAAAEPAVTLGGRIREADVVRDRFRVEGTHEDFADAQHAAAVGQLAPPVEVVERSQQRVSFRVGEVVGLAVVWLLEAISGSSGVIGR